MTQTVLLFTLYLKRFNLVSTIAPVKTQMALYCIRAAECSLIAPFRMTKPTQKHEPIWSTMFASNKGSLLKTRHWFIILMNTRSSEEIHDQLSLQAFSILHSELLQ
ncbi:hypothetical protein AVEN_175001-1 [Araneus ventricosus]|uniref:Uncharacterized protein n=1 Tax=Araneus ventricosus TaxID=182803 RepID=A0A4Y2KJU8_ARAVE|nr:hypothetical protein AVEN_175001-1 [Araneus ventricosus]